MSISTHLIAPRLNAVFLHVQDVKRAAAWYHQLLQLPFDASRVSSPVYNLPLEGPTSLTLDDQRMTQRTDITLLPMPCLIFIRRTSMHPISLCGHYTHPSFETSNVSMSLLILRLRIPTVTS